MSPLFSSQHRNRHNKKVPSLTKSTTLTMGFFKGLKRISTPSQSSKVLKQNPSTKVVGPVPAPARPHKQLERTGNSDGNRRRKLGPRDPRNASPRKTQRKKCSGHFRNVHAAKFVEEQTDATTSLPDSYGSNDTHKLMVIAASAGETSCEDPRTTRHNMQEIEPWLEPSPILHPTASSTTYPTLCSALEMLSFETLCGGGLMMKSLNENILVSMRPEADILQDVDPASDPHRIPREISFERKTSRQRTRSSNREEMEIMEFYGGPPASFLRGLLGFKTVGRKTTPKVKIYCETPVPLEHTNSVENSTITWPAEFQHNGKLNVMDEHHL
jgi:hypothetical protein